MQELLDNLVTFIKANGGKVTHDDALVHLGLERNKMPTLIKMGRASGVLKRELPRDAETGKATLFLVATEG